MTLHHTRCQEENAELYYYHFKYVVIVPGSALTNNGRSASEFKLRSQGIRLTSPAPPSLSCLAVCLLPVCYFWWAARDQAWTGLRTWGGLKLECGGGGGCIGGLPMSLGMESWNQHFCLIKMWWLDICYSFNSEKVANHSWCLHCYGFF